LAWESYVKATCDNTRASPSGEASSDRDAWFEKEKKLLFTNIVRAFLKIVTFPAKTMD